MSTPGGISYTHAVITLRSRTPQLHLKHAETYPYVPVVVERSRINDNYRRGIIYSHRFVVGRRYGFGRDWGMQIWVINIFRETVVFDEIFIKG